MKRKGKEEYQVNRRSERWKGFLPRLVEVKEGLAANPKIAQRHKRGFRNDSGGAKSSVHITHFIKLLKYQDL